MTDFRALCAELVEAWDGLPWEFDWRGNLVGPFANIDEEPFERARAALAQPESQGPTDEDLRALWRLGWQSKDPEDGAVLFAKEVLGRWGRPAIEPVPVAERLPGPEDCDAEGRCYAWDGYWWLVRSAALEEDDTGAGDGYTHWLPHNALPVPQQGE